MLIKYQGMIINLSNVRQFYKGMDKKDLIFMFISADYYFSFEDERKRDIAFEKILDYVRWQRSVCDLDE